MNNYISLLPLPPSLPAFQAVALSVIFLVFGGAGGGYVNKPVSHWSAEDVMEWMSGLGETIQQDCKEVFHREVCSPLALFK